jgi:hypothetical protein
VQRDGQEYPFIAVPPGVQTPVAAKSDLTCGGKAIIRDHAVYVRSISSNNTVSTTEARRGDWDRLIRNCFDNREADIGAFFRRHLAGLDVQKITGVFKAATIAHATPPPLERVVQVLDAGRGRYGAEAKERRLAGLDAVGFREAAILIDGKVPSHRATESFLQRLFVAMPRYSGWPPWLDSTPASEKDERPYVHDGGWEAFLCLNQTVFGSSLDFWRIDPKGSFYHIRALEDDLSKSSGGPEPHTVLDFLIQVSRTTEIIAVGLSFARSMGCVESETSLAFAFRWMGLKGRHLASWVDRRRNIYARVQTHQDEVMTTVSVPLETPPSSIPQYVEMAVKDLFAAFGGKEFDLRVIEGIANDVLQQRF